MRRQLQNFAGIVLFAGAVFAQANQSGEVKDLGECIRQQLLKVLKEPGGADPGKLQVSPQKRFGPKFDVLDLTSSGIDATPLNPNARPFLALVDDTTIAEPRVIEALDRSRAVFVLKASGVESAQAALTQTIGRPEIIAAIPLDEKGVERVFGIPEAQAGPATDHLQRASVAFKRLPNSRILMVPDAQESVAEELLDAAGHRSANLLVVVGHNNDGTLELPDGSSVPVALLQKRFTESGRPGLILACETVSTGSGAVTIRRLGFQEIASALKATIALRPSDRYGDYLYVLQDQLGTLEISKRNHTKYIIVAAVAGTGGSALLLAFHSSREPCHDSTSHGCNDEPGGRH